MTYVDMIDLIRNRFEKRSYNCDAKEFNPDTVRFLLVATELPMQETEYLEFFKIIDDVNAWGMASMRMNANDYVIANPVAQTKNWISVLHSFWMVADNKTALIFTLKYNNAIVMNINKTTMKKYFNRATDIVKTHGKKVDPMNIDFMNLLATEPQIKKARTQYAKKYYPI